MSYPANLQGPTEMRGRHFGFLAILCTTWVTARVGILMILHPNAVQSPVPHLLDNGQSTRHAAAPPLNGWPPPPDQKCCADSIDPPSRVDRSDGRPKTGALLRPADLVMVDAATLLRSVSPGIWVGSLPDPKPGHKKSKPARLRVYAYSFWRADSSGQSLTSGGQYGGSQSGFIATYDIARLGRNDTPKLALIARSAIAHDDLRERELAAGLRWWPLAKGGFSLTAERRFRNGRPDAFAAYVAGGKSDIALPLKFRLDSYGQAGFVSGDSGGPFFDAAARAERPLAMIAKTPIAGGIGIWAGGQEDLLRVDIGPTIRADLDIGKVPLRLHADWRFRIAGDARPASGPALTLSTAF